MFLLEKSFSNDHDSIVASVPHAADCHHFGSGPLRVMRYPHDIPLISGFLRAIQAPPAAMMLPGRDLRVNESLADNALLAALEGRGLPPELPDLDQPARDRLIDSFADSNEAVRARYFPENRTLFGLD